MLSLSARVQGKAQGGKRRMKSTQDIRFVCAERLSATKQTQSLGQADLVIIKIKSSGSLPSFSCLSLSYINVSHRPAPNNRKHKGPTDKLNESSPEELEHYISIQGLSSISVQRVFRRIQCYYISTHTKVPFNDLKLLVCSRNTADTF